jgi:hypothetical protein
MARVASSRAQFTLENPRFSDEYDSIGGGRRNDSRIGDTLALRVQ